jgi:serine/threonine-protein phosphatase 2A regulatory subunit A
MQNENVQLRLNSIRRLATIATALGPERTRTELVPFLTDSNDDEDECLLAIAEELANLIPKVGGPEHAHVLLAPLENLATVEETVVRDKAVAAACAVGEAMTSEGATTHYVPCVQRLANGDWFTARVSACGMFAVAYRKVADAGVRSDLRKTYAQLCADETPMTRRAAAQHLGAFAGEIEPEQDSVRLLAVEDCAKLGKILPREECVADVVPVVKKFAADKSWRVRYMVAQQLYELCESIGADIAREELLPSYEQLLMDGEAEVRIASAGGVSSFCALVGAAAAGEKIIPRVKELASDGSQHVRAALASVIMGLAPTMGKDQTIEQLLPIFLTLLKDEFPEVRLNIIAKLDQVNHVIGVDLLSQELLPAIKDLAEDIHWRVRLAIIEYIPLLASQMGTSFLFQKSEADGGDQLNALCLQWLSDRVYSIREAAAVNLQKLAEVFGAEWAKTHIMPKVMELMANPHYLYRMSVIKTMTLLAGCVGQELCMTEILPALKAAAKDRVPNVRFSVAKAFGDIASALDRGVVEGEIKPILNELGGDADADVRFFAQQSIASCEAKA